MRKYEKHWVYYLYFHDLWMALSLLRYREGPQLDEPEDAAQRTMGLLRVVAGPIQTPAELMV